MRGYRFILSIVCACILCGCGNTPQAEPIVRECTSIPTEGRASASVCAADGKAYVFGGRDSHKHYLNDLWTYSPQEDKWTDLGATPLRARVKATMVAQEEKLYVGLGYSALSAYNDSAYQQDWWEYTPSVNQWKRLADYPNKNTVAALAYAEAGKIYVLYGNGRFFTSEIGVYTIATDTWEIMPNNANRASSCFGACAARQKDILYFGTGFNSHNLTQWYSVDAAKDHWQKLCSLPGKGRQWSVCAATEDYIYLFGGRHFAGEMTGGEVFENYMRYSPEKDQWEWCGTMPCGRAENMIAFSMNGKAYFGLGENENGTCLTTLYCIEE